MSRYRLDSVLRIDQCTLQYRIRLFNSVLQIYFQCTLMCDGVLPVMDLNNRYIIIVRTHSITFGVMYTFMDR